MSIHDALEKSGLTLPQVAAPAANYVPYVISGNQIFVAGQIPFLNGEAMHQGRLGDSFTVEDGKKAAQACALNILAQVDAAVGGDWARVQKCVKLGAFVCCTPDFTDHPAVVNGASDLMVEVLGEKGKHARFAVGVPSLPLGVAVEIDAVFEIK